VALGLCVLQPGMARAQSTNVQVSTEPAGLAVYRVVPRGGSGSYAQSSSDSLVPLCTAPCVAALRPGLADFALRAGEGSAQKVHNVLVPPGTTRLGFRLRDQSAQRRLGLGLAAASAAAGSLLLFAGQHEDPVGCSGASCTSAPVVAGLGIGVISLGVLAGLMTLVLYPDRVGYWTDRCRAPAQVRW
jgi:hypothetical protein